MATATRQQKILLLDSDRPSHGRRLHKRAPSIRHRQVQGQLLAITLKSS